MKAVNENAVNELSKKILVFIQLLMQTISIPVSEVSSENWGSVI